MRSKVGTRLSHKAWKQSHAQQITHSKNQCHLAGSPQDVQLWVLFYTESRIALILTAHSGYELGQNVATILLKANKRKTPVPWLALCEAADLCKVL